MRTVTLLMVLFLAGRLEAARCAGSDHCTACKTCSSCNHCHKDGGTCGVSAGRVSAKPAAKNSATDRATREPGEGWVPYAVGGAAVAAPVAWWIGRRGKR